MFTQTPNRISLESFHEQAAGKKVILLYSWVNYRNLFLSYFLTSAKDGLLYYRIPHDAQSVTQWLGGLIDELDDMVGGFGTHTRAMLDSRDAVALGEALARDLCVYPTEHTVLFLDDLDRVVQDDYFAQFVQGLVSGLNGQTQLVVSSRLLAYDPWRALAAAGEAVILGTQHRQRALTFTVQTTPKPQLEVYGLGAGFVLINGKLIEHWDGVLPRNLFFYFVDNPLVTRDDIFRTFWPELHPKDATNVFHVTKRKIGERIVAKLGLSESYELTQYINGFYIPSDKIVRHYDVTDFLSAVEDAAVARDEHQAENLYARAIDSYKAPFLTSVNMPWAMERREQLRQSYAQALIGMGRIAQGRNLLEHARGFFSRALKETPEREDIHREMIRLYGMQGMIDDARLHYQRLEQYLHKTVGIGPALETRQTFDAVITGQM